MFLIAFNKSLKTKSTHHSIHLTLPGIPSSTMQPYSFHVILFISEILYSYTVFDSAEIRIKGSHLSNHIYSDYKFCQELCNMKARPPKSSFASQQSAGYNHWLQAHSEEEQAYITMANTLIFHSFA